jgi:hypothetical protein
MMGVEKRGRVSGFRGCDATRQTGCPTYLAGRNAATGRKEGGRGRERGANGFGCGSQKLVEGGTMIWDGY